MNDNELIPKAFAYLKSISGKELILTTKDDLLALFRLIAGETQRKKEKEWILESELQEMLGGVCKTTIWNMRKNGLIEYTNPTESRKPILYSRSSAMKLLEKNKKKAFNL